ncbi:MAG: radical SAM protein [Candidatus Omnitrophica bacterium]|nr:radical SAM protein [Candidatus Omnitrophota bacterium]
MRINKDQICISERKDLKFNYLRGRGHLVAYLLNRWQWYNLPRFHHVSKFPIHLDIETSALCNMQCPMCFTTTGDFRQKVDKGFMDFSLFKKIIDEAVSYKIYSIRLSHRGEPFINPQIVDFISYAKRAGVKEVSSLSNILALTPELFEKSMKAGLDWLTISFDGLKENYEKIRKPAVFEESVQKIKEYKRIKEAAKSSKPVIKIQSVWPAIKDCADEYIDLFDPYVDAITSNPLIDYLHNDELEKIEYWENFDCPVPYQRLTILFDGLVPYCHNDEFNTFIIGDIKLDKVYNIWNGLHMTKVRQSHREHKGVELLSACKRCFLPRKVEPIVENFGGKKVIVEKYTKRIEEIGK